MIFSNHFMKKKHINFTFYYIAICIVIIIVLLFSDVTRTISKSYLILYTLFITLSIVLAFIIKAHYKNKRLHKDERRKSIKDLFYEETIVLILERIYKILLIILFSFFSSSFLYFSFLNLTNLTLTTLASLSTFIGLYILIVAILNSSNKRKILNDIILSVTFLLGLWVISKLSTKMLNCNHSTFLFSSLFFFGLIALEIYLVTKLVSPIFKKINLLSKTFLKISNWEIWSSNMMMFVYNALALTIIFGWIIIGQSFMNYLNDKFTTPRLLAKKYYYQSIETYRIGSICNDGTHSFAKGSGACSHHGGVFYWIEDTVFLKSFEKCLYEAKEFSLVD